LRTMNEKRTKLNAAQALLLAALAVGALVVACDTPVPTQVQDALIEAMDEEAVVRTEAEMERRAEELLLARASGMDDAPLIYVDGVRINGLNDLEGVFLPSLDPDDIDRIEVIKGPAAERLYGEEGANGVIQIFMKLGEGEDLELRVQGDPRDVHGDPREKKVAIKGNVLVPTRANN